MNPNQPLCFLNNILCWCPLSNPGESWGVRRPFGRHWYGDQRWATVIRVTWMGFVNGPTWWGDMLLTVIELCTGLVDDHGFRSNDLCRVWLKHQAWKLGPETCPLIQVDLLSGPTRFFEISTRSFEPYPKVDSITVYTFDLYVRLSMIFMCYTYYINSKWPTCPNN